MDLDQALQEIENALAEASDYQIQDLAYTMRNQNPVLTPRGVAPDRFLVYRGLARLVREAGGWQSIHSGDFRDTVTSIVIERAWDVLEKAALVARQLFGHDPTSPRNPG